MVIISLTCPLILKPQGHGGSPFLVLTWFLLLQDASKVQACWLTKAS